MAGISTRARFGLAILAVFASVGIALASGATFTVTGQGITLGEPSEDGDGPVQFKAKAERGKPFTLVAQGLVIPRAGKPHPGEPESGKWTFDEKHFKKLPPEGKAADKTKVVIRLEPTAAGTSRVRFVGKLLGYERKYEVLIEVSDRKKD